MGFSFSSVLGKCESAGGAYGVTALGVMQRWSLRKSWKAEKHEHAGEEQELNGDSGSILAFFISHTPCSHL